MRAVTRSFGLRVALGCLVLVPGCSPREEERAHSAGERAHEEDAHLEEDRVELDAATRAEFGIEVEIAGSAWIEGSATLPGEVRPNEDRLAHIAPRYAGIAREVKAEIGDPVEAGQELAVVESENLAPFALATLIEGTVIEKHITRGEPIAPSSTAFVVADLRDVWIDISVYQRDLPRIAVGQPVRLSAGHGLAVAEGEIAYLAPIVSEVTRTAIARVVLPNPEGRWRPGMFVTARVRVEREEVPVAVPPGAVQRLEGQTVVLVESAGGFEPRPVVLGRRDEEAVEIREGLRAGELVVTHGGFTIVSELQRGALSGGHHH